MKKITALLTGLILSASMAMPAFAVTPTLESPDLPEIPDISGSVEIDLPDSTFDHYFEEHPIELTPDEPIIPAAFGERAKEVERWKLSSRQPLPAYWRFWARSSPAS